MEFGPDPKVLKDIVTMKMPFGKHQGQLLCDLPINYLEWFNRKGFPKGRLGTLLVTVYEIKLNGLDMIIKKLKSELSR